MESKLGQRFGIQNFRVLTLTISEKRQENLRALARQADDRGQGSPMFLFACDKNFTMEQPLTILTPIWRSPGDDSYQSILG